MPPSDKPEQNIDQHSGVPTTGHEWDGIKELNNPAPRWWIWVFILTCVWALGYWILYPSWPTFSGNGERGGLTGYLGWTQYEQLQKQQVEIMARRAVYLEQFQESSFEEILANEELYAFAIAGGKSAFKDNCATCHGTGGTGARGYPNLNDDDWLWGGSLEAIHQTIKYGVRAAHDETKISEMPSFADILSQQEIDDITAYVIGLSDGTQAPEEAALLFEEQCAACHGSDGQGNQELGAPNLADSIWFYGDGNAEDIASQIANPKHGVMPHWDDRLDKETIRQLTVYVHSLGGGT